MHLRGYQPRGLPLKSSNIEEVWTVAAELTRKRASSAKNRGSVVVPRETIRFSDDNFRRRYLGRTSDRMRLDVNEKVVCDGREEPEVVVSSTSGGERRAADNASWINKYQHSDHHVDRMVRTIVDYESMTGEKFPETFKNTSSAIPYLVYVQQAKSLADSGSSFPLDAPYRQTIETRRSVEHTANSLPRNSLDGATNNYVKMPIQSRRPPLGPNNGVRLTTHYAPTYGLTSLPVHESMTSSLYSTYTAPLSSAHARRASISSAIPRYYVTSGSSSSYLPPESIRRASFSGAAPTTGSYRPETTYRPRLASDSARMSVDRLSEYEYQPTGGRRMSISRAPSSTGGHSRSVSRERSIPLATTSTAKVSDARKKIRSVLNKTGGDSENYFPVY